MTTCCRSWIHRAKSPSDMDFSQYKLMSDDELDRFRDPDPARFFRFQHKVYTLLDRLQVGQRVYLKDILDPGDYEVFIKCACAYILMHRKHWKMEDSTVEPSADYSYFIRQPGLVCNVVVRHFYSERRRYHP